MANLISSLNSILIDNNWFVVVLNSFKCWTIDVPPTIFRLKSFFIGFTMLFAYNFSYIPDKATIKVAVVFSLITLCATNLDRVNQITPKPVYLTSSSQHLPCCSAFFPTKRSKVSSHKDNPQSAFSDNEICVVKLLTSKYFHLFSRHRSHSNPTSCWGSKLLGKCFFPIDNNWFVIALNSFRC